jgi:hypothetical protein
MTAGCNNDSQELRNELQEEMRENEIVMNPKVLRITIECLDA